MRTTCLTLLLVVSLAAGAGEWRVSDADSFGWRRALIAVGGDRLAIVCPPNAAPFAVPVADAALADGGGHFTLGLEIDGERHDQAMVCSDVLCEAELSQAAWQALVRGDRVTLWVDDWRGPSFPLDGSATALRACNPDY